MFRTIWAFKTNELIMNNCFAIQRYRALSIFILFFYLTISQYLTIFYFKFDIQEKVSSIFEFFTKFPFEKCILLTVYDAYFKSYNTLSICNAQCKLESL